MIENESNDEINNELTEQDDYAINTSTIYHNEFSFIRDPDAFSWKKLPSDYDHQLENLVQQLLADNVEPVADYSDDRREYLIDRYEKFHEAHFNVDAFRLHYFVTASDKPRSKTGKNRLVFTGDKYYYLYGYDQHFIAKKKELDDYQFELLFAFALRQCDLMRIHSFLQYHLINNFDGKVKQYCKYLTQINRKFIGIFFTTELYESIKDWVLENENKGDFNVSKKIKTHLTVDQLAFLFRALVDNGHLNNNYKARIIEWACENFESKQMPVISSISFDSDYYQPTHQALDFWIDNFDKLTKIAVRIKQKKKP